MTYLKYALCVGILLLTVAVMPASASQAQPPAQQEEFVPIDQLPPQDRMPAAPLVISAYTFVWVAFFLYMLSIARRLAVVQRELERLETDMKRGSGRT
jgi:CcmD family protein